MLRLSVLLSVVLVLCSAPLLATVRTVGPVACHYTTLSAAVAAADAGDVIRLHKDYDAPTNVRIEKPLTLIGGLPHCFAGSPETASSISVLTSDSPAPRQVLDIRGGVLVQLFHLRLTGATSLGGLNIQDGATVQVAGLEVDGNSALFGGGIWLHGASTLQVIEAPFGSALTGLNVHANSAPQGGGMYVGSGALLERLPGGANISIWDNTATDIGGNSSRGGGLYIQSGGSAVGVGSVFANVARRGGGAYVEGRPTDDFFSNSDLQVIDGLHGNNASLGGGVYVAASVAAVVVLDRLFRNHAGQQGGGLWFGSDGDATVGVIENNSSSGVGGGIYQAAGSLWIGDELIDNTATGDGGGLHAVGGVRDFAGGIEIARNRSTAGSGGALWISGAGDTRLPGNDGSACDDATPCVIADNQAAADGGAIYLLSSKMGVTSSGSASGFGLQVSGNSSSGSGGALYAGSGSAVRINVFALQDRVTGSQWVSNSASTAGGAILLSNSDLVISDAQFGGDTLAEANVSPFGGAVYVSGVGSTGLGLEIYGHNLRFIGNRAMQKGGALYASGGARVELDTVKCASSALPANRYCQEFRANGSFSGSAIYTLGASLALRHAAVIGNVGGNGDDTAIFLNGHGSSNLIENVLLSSNEDRAIRLDDLASHGTDLLLRSSTLVNHPASAILLADEASVSLDIQNSVLWDNLGTEIAGLSGHASASQLCSLIASGLLGAISADPVLISNPRGDYRLNPMSPAIDACLSGPDRDLDGNFRDAAPDIGAFEFGGTLPDLIFDHGFESS